MAEIFINYLPLQTLGIVTCNVPFDVMYAIKNEIEDIQNNNFKKGIPVNSKLAGAILHEYKLQECVPVFSKFIDAVVPEYWRLNNNAENAKKKHNLKLNNDGSAGLWVNFQKKYEYNPLHSHGGDISFVLYVSLPYDMEEEINQPHIINNTNPRGPGIDFLFPSLNSYPPVSNFFIPLDKSWENKIIMFPSWLQHLVNPFCVCDELRISVAGNIVHEK